MPLKIDKMVDFLAKEDKYWVGTLNNTELWDARKKKTKNDKVAYQRTQAKKPRVTAADYIIGSGKGAGGGCGSQLTTTTTTTTATANQSVVDLDEYKDESDIDLVGPQLPFPLLSPNSAIHTVLAKISFTEQGLFA
jgi:hypothetical protein